MHLMSIRPRGLQPGCNAASHRSGFRRATTVTQILHLVRALIWINESVRKQEHGANGNHVPRNSRNGIREHLKWDQGIDVSQFFPDLHQ